MLMQVADDDYVKAVDHELQIIKSESEQYQDDTVRLTVSSRELSDLV